MLETIKKIYRKIRADVLSCRLRKDFSPDMPVEEIEASREISIIVAVHDAPGVTRLCLQSLMRFGEEAQIILVDDGSVLDETKILLKTVSEKNGWRLIRNEKALSHSRACEVGAAVADRKYLCLLNSDTIVTQRSWKGIVDCFDADEKIAVVGPSTSCTCTCQRIKIADYCRFFWNTNQIWHFAEKHTCDSRYRDMVFLNMIGGFAFFIRKKIWDEFGGFDKGLADYGNETDLCRQLSKSGYRLAWTPRSYIHHYSESSFLQYCSKDEISQKKRKAEDYIQSKNSK